MNRHRWGLALALTMTACAAAPPTTSSKRETATPASDSLPRTAPYPPSDRVWRLADFEQANRALAADLAAGKPLPSLQDRLFLRMIERENIAFADDTQITLENRGAPLRAIFAQIQALLPPYSRARSELFSLYSFAFSLARRLSELSDEQAATKGWNLSPRVDGSAASALGRRELAGDFAELLQSFVHTLGEPGSTREDARAALQAVGKDFAILAQHLPPADLQRVNVACQEQAKKVAGTSQEFAKELRALSLAGETAPPVDYTIRADGTLWKGTELLTALKFTKGRPSAARAFAQDLEARTDRHRHPIRILISENARYEALFEALYTAGASGIIAFELWLLRSDGTQETFVPLQFSTFHGASMLTALFANAKITLQAPGIPPCSVTQEQPLPENVRDRQVPAGALTICAANMHEVLGSGVSPGRDEQVLATDNVAIATDPTTKIGTLFPAIQEIVGDHWQLFSAVNFGIPR